jgi:hypothetical protein
MAQGRPSPAEQAANMRHNRDYAQDGPIFPDVKAAHPRAGDADIKQAISAAVRFERACFKYFIRDSTDYWERCVNAVARAEQENPLSGEHVSPRGQRRHLLQ